jgi:hypothetical protein
MTEYTLQKKKPHLELRVSADLSRDEYYMGQKYNPYGYAAQPRKPGSLNEAVFSQWFLLMFEQCIGGGGGGTPPQTATPRTFAPEWPSVRNNFLHILAISVMNFRAGSNDFGQVKGTTQRRAAFLAEIRSPCISVRAALK